MLPQTEQSRIWLCNTDVESEWAESCDAGQLEHGERSVIFHRFEEILLPSIGEKDVAILRTSPDPDFLLYLESIGLVMPEILVPTGAEEKPWEPTTQLVRDDPELIGRLAHRVQSGKSSILEPFGVSKVIESIAAQTGLQIRYSGSDKAAFISKKSSARRLASQLGFPLPDGEICEDPQEIPKIARRLHSAENGCPVVIKPEFGASGRGQYLLQTNSDIDRLAIAIDSGELGGVDTTHVVERWYSVRSTMTYSFSILKNGKAPGPVVAREAIGEKGPCHYGYYYPVHFDDDGKGDLQSVVNQIAQILQKEYSYFGPIRCDALLLNDGRLFPLLEINARHSFFTFTNMIQQRLSPGGAGLFRWFFFRSPGHMKFQDLVEQLIGSELLFDPNRGEGIIIPTFGTVTVCEDISTNSGGPPLRRLFILVLAETVARARAFEKRLRDRMEAQSIISFV